MVEKKKYSRTYFIIGLSIGLLIGLYFSFKNRRNETAETLTPIYIQSNSEKNANKTKHYNNNKKKKKKINNEELQDSILLDSNSLNIDSLLSDTLLNDSLQNDSLSTNLDSMEIKSDSLEFKPLHIETSNNEDIQISKDELIYVMYAYPEGTKSDFMCKTNGKLDSVLVNNTKSRTDNGLYVEFWHSPINYSGYKLGFNTLILYGFYEYTSINLKYMNNGQLLLLYKGHKYILKCTDEFINLEIKKE